MPRASVTCEFHAVEEFIRHASTSGTAQRVAVHSLPSPGMQRSLWNLWAAGRYRLAMYVTLVFVLVHFRAAQKLNLSSSPHRRRRSGDENIGSDEQPIFPNGYAALLLKSPPPAPPALLRRIGVKELTGVGKVSSLIIFLKSTIRIFR